MKCIKENRFSENSSLHSKHSEAEHQSKPENKGREQSFIMGRDRQTTNERDRLRIKLLKLILYKNRIEEHQFSASTCNTLSLKYDEDDYEKKKIKKRRTKILACQNL